jgi:predicted O-methyltransferase YrrM
MRGRYLKRAIVTGGIALAALCVVFAQRRGRTGPESEQHPPLAKTESEKKILATLSGMVEAGELFANVPAADGRMLRLLTEAAGAKHVVEIGTSTGISGLWFTLALEKTGGKLTTFELDSDRAATARANFKKAAVDRLVTVIEGDAHQNVTRLKEPIDVLFLDADKEGYVDYLGKLLPLVRPGGLVLAHNVDMVPDYIKTVSTSPDLETVLYMQGGGLAVTLKKR